MVDSLAPEAIHHFAPIHKVSRSDVHFPLSTQRRYRAPSITSTTEMLWDHSNGIGKLSLRVKAVALPRPVDISGPQDDAEMAVLELGSEPEAESEPEPESNTADKSFQDLPPEIQGRIVDHIFGDMHSITSNSTSLLPGSKSLSSSMRHPRRKAVSDLALVCSSWRELVQQRIYRHIKIKGTRAGLNESTEFFTDHMHLARYIRHIEFWVPVWGDKASLERSLGPSLGAIQTHHILRQTGTSLISADELLGFNFKLSVYSSTLSEIFQHINCFFSAARIFTLEGGHCKKSNMIRQFHNTLFPDPNQALEPLPHIRTFSMRGAWNIMREYGHWTTIEKALPNVQEWHCAYAKPKPEAYATISRILLNMPLRLRHVNISLDGFYSKENTIVGSPGQTHHHLCERLGRVAPHLESISFTGKICSCFWTSACEGIKRAKEESKLKAVELVVKSCCRPQFVVEDADSPGGLLTEAANVMADGASITNMAFIRAFERLTVAAVRSLESFRHLDYIRVRFIDLDSPCALLNPYFQLVNGKCYGLWNEDILNMLPNIRPGVEYEELAQGINPTWRKDDIIVGTIHPRTKPKSMKTSAYKILADGRGTATL